MKRYIPLLSLFLLAQCSSIYYENAFPRMLKTELKLVENAEADTVYVIYFNATVNGPGLILYSNFSFSLL